MLASNRTILAAVLSTLFAHAAIAQAIGPVPGSGGGGSGTVTSVSVTTQNGVSASVTNPTTTPNLAFTLGAITPSSVAIGAGSAITSSGGGGSLTALAFTSPGSGVATALGNTAGGTGGFALVGSTPPTGAAGGSLKGTYPNPGLADVNTIATSLAVGGATIGSNALAVTGAFALGGQATSSSATTTAPGWYVQLTGDTVARAAFGLDTADNPRIGFGPGGSTARDTFLMRDAANTLAQRNGTTAQSFRVYNTYTDASNYERGVFDWSTTANTLTIGTAAAGTGTARNMALQAGGSGAAFITSASFRLDSRNLIFNTDNANDIGAVAANRPRTIYAGTDVTAGGNITGAAFIPTGSTVPTNGIYLPLANTVGISLNSANRVTFGTGAVNNAIVSTGWSLNMSAPSSTVPSLIPNRSDTTTGIGAQAAGNMSMIAGGAEIARVTATAFQQIAGQTVMKNYTVGTLPTGIQYGRAFVSDQLTSCPAIGLAMTGGGSVVCPVYYNGSAWVSG